MHLDIAKILVIAGGHAILFLRRPRLKGHPFQIRYKQDWGQGFILVLPQAATLPRSDGGSNDVKQASSFVRKAVRSGAPCGTRCIGHAIRAWSAVRSMDVVRTCNSLFYLEVRNSCCRISFLFPQLYVTGC